MVLNKSELIKAPTLPNLAESPFFYTKIPVECELDRVFPNQKKDFTCSVTETSLQSKENICQNSKLFFTLFCKKCEKYYIVPVGCHQRTCQTCAAARQKKLIWKYVDACRTMQNPKLITLTAPWFESPHQGVISMRAAFVKLRRRKPFKDLFRTGLYGFHFISKPGGFWFVHIHALIDTKYIPQKILNTAWSKCMPGAEVTDIRKAWSPKGGLKYVLGYITAPPLGLCSASEFNADMKGLHTVSTLGHMASCQIPSSQFICPFCGAASYGYEHKTKYFVKWHNTGLKGTDWTTLPFGT